MTVPVRQVALTIDGKPASVPEGSTLRDACEAQGIETPTLCWAANLTPINVCRVCVVEVEGARVLAPACSRKVEPGMVVKTDSERVRTSRKLVLELLGSSVDMSTAPAFKAYAERYGAKPERFGPKAEPSPAGKRDASHPGPHEELDGVLYVFDSTKCMLCYKCVQACGTEAQNTFAIAVAGRGFEARISTEHAVPIPESACVYCGNCVGACPTGALMFKSEFELRQAGTWDESKQTVTDTICPYCGVGCTLSLRVQDNRIVRVTSPSDNSVTGGHLCVKGRFGFEFVQNREDGE
jgi:predicted molibdopterin-dependent oxidoreductase YjgC